MRKRKKHNIKVKENPGIELAITSQDFLQHMQTVSMLKEDMGWVKDKLKNLEDKMWFIITGIIVMFLAEIIIRITVK